MEFWKKKVYSAAKITLSLIPLFFLSIPPALAFHCPCKQTIPETSPVHVILQETGNVSKPGNNDSNSIGYKGFPPQASLKKHDTVNNIT